MWVTDCIFCKIVKKELPAKVVFEDENVVAFEDINPVAPVHILLIPKKHIPTPLELKKEDGALIGSIYLTAVRLAKEMSLAERGFRLVMNCQKDAGQTVFHLHLHLLGGRPFKWPPG